MPLSQVVFPGSMASSKNLVNVIKRWRRGGFLYLSNLDLNFTGTRDFHFLGRPENTVLKHCSDSHL